MILGVITTSKVQVKVAQSSDFLENAGLNIQSLLDMLEYLYLRLEKKNDYLQLFFFFYFTYYFTYFIITYLINYMIF